MTNDLNTIPASVRDAMFIPLLEEDFKRVKELLSRPNIVIVDLDDDKLVERVARALILEDSPNNNELDIARNLEFYIPVATTALAALKEK